MKVLFTCSSGGHLEELMQLKKIIKTNDSYLLTETGHVNKSMFKDVYVEKQINRKENFFLLRLIYLSMKSVYIFLNVKPRIVISTGALVTVPVCLIAKLFNKRVIYIESFARIYTPSLTGKIMYRVADIFIVQWKELLRIFPKANYLGGIF